MRFWDANAIVPLLLQEEKTVECKGFLEDDEGIVVWWITNSECISALARKAANGELQPIQVAQARVRLHALSEAWSEVQPVPVVKALAETLIFRHPFLRTADAYQLSAAIHWRENRPNGAEFVCYDGRLRAAAESEGFTVLGS